MNQEDTDLGVTTDEWKAEIERLQHEQYGELIEGGETVGELTQKLKLPKSTVYEYVDNLVAKGRCLKGLGWKINRRGQRRIQTVYKLTPKKKGKK